MTDLRHAHDAARSIAAAALGHDPGHMSTAPSSSHHVYVGADAVVKLIEADGHARLNREIALAPHLPAGLTAPLLDSGVHRLGTRPIRYACYARVPGTAPGIHLPGVDRATARALAEQAVQRLLALHTWTPSGPVAELLAEPLDHGGFTGREALVADVDALARLDRHGTVPRPLLDGLRALAERAPHHARAHVPVHADCHWGNWLARDADVTALLDFEWARFGEPADDWMFLVRFSGPHLETVLDVVSRATHTPVASLRAACEIRETAHLVSDLRIALEHSDAQAQLLSTRLLSLDELVAGRYWWRAGLPRSVDAE
ncbi:phosphotransferase [Streptomyces sp. NBC_00083]|uniref:phosphotransferase n=1 Tax=Streptomyces sp. NBC_00083 TaxID=2975647 RepID=UPI00224D7C23|nr:phosphotransferase [Streptomyces sp. NBC_00083]MCX5384407.1 phosphotransferase [Streptomyces sp. NBC_00083]